jgi:hypothetical protein
MDTDAEDVSATPYAWHTVCYIFSQMQALHVLKMQLCHSAFSDVLFDQSPNRMISNEGWVFEPLTQLAREKGKSLGLFEVEVDWPDGGEGWHKGNVEMGFELLRVGPRGRGW